MKLTSNIITVIYWVLVVARPSHQYVYSCDANVTCGCSNNPASLTRIVGGEAAGTSTWDWAVSIYINSSSLCGGSILSNSWVVTAAHCLSSGVLPSQVTVYAGSNTRFSGQSRIASSITIHPSYNTATQVNDIALLMLSTPLAIPSSTVNIICMPSVSSSTLSAGEWPPVGIYVVAVGWGTLAENGSLPLALQQVTVQTIDYNTSGCHSLIYDSQKQFCAGISTGGKDTCQGDSGGPLMMFTTSNQWALVGLTSYGIGCARPGLPGVYTRIAAYQDWIATTTGGAYTNATSSNTANINPYASTNSSQVTSDASSVSSLSFFLFSSFIIIIYVS